ncbi:hypothetical protein V3C99_003560 [Haemonchus contortus]
MEFDKTINKEGTCPQFEFVLSAPRRTHFCEFVSTPYLTFLKNNKRNGRGFKFMMSDRPSTSSATSLKTAVTSLKEVLSSANTLNEDIRELLEQIEIVEKLPESTNLARIDGWRSRLLTKMRMKMSQIEAQYRELIDLRWMEILKTIRTYGPAMSHISYTFASDLQLVEDFFSKALRIAASNVLFSSNIRATIPTIPYNVEVAISRIVFDIGASIA